MWTRFILTHPYFPQTVYRFRHIFHRAHAIMGILKLRVRRGRSFIELQYWTVVDTISRLLLALAVGVGNWVKIRPLKHTVSKWSMMKSQLQVAKTMCYASLRREI